MITESMRAKAREILAAAAAHPLTTRYGFVAREVLAMAGQLVDQEQDREALQAAVTDLARQADADPWGYRGTWLASVMVDVEETFCTPEELAKRRDEADDIARRLRADLLGSGVLV